MDFEMAERNTWKLKGPSHGSSGLPSSLQCEYHKIYYVIMFLSVITNVLILNKNVYYATHTAAVFLLVVKIAAPLIDI